MAAFGRRAARATAPPVGGASSGHAVSLDVYRLSPDTVTAQLSAAGLAVTARLVRDAIEPERQQQAFLLARKHGSEGADLRR